jgi:hypothetical protein
MRISFQIREDPGRIGKAVRPAHYIGGGGNSQTQAVINTRVFGAYRLPESLFPFCCYHIATGSGLSGPRIMKNAGLTENKTIIQKNRRRSNLRGYGKNLTGVNLFIDGCVYHDEKIKSPSAKSALEEDSVIWRE